MQAVFEEDWHVVGQHRVRRRKNTGSSVEIEALGVKECSLPALVA